MGYDNTVIARRYMNEILEKADYEALDELVAEDLILRDASADEGQGHQYLKDRMQIFHTAFPDLSLQLDEIATAGDRVVIRWTARGTHRGPLFKIAPTNKQSMVRGCEILRIRDGKVREDSSYWDAYGMLQQLGVVPKMEELRGPEAPSTRAPQPRT